MSRAKSQDPVTAGNNLTYTLTVKNAGPSFARSVQVTDPVPGGTSYVSSDTGGMNVAGTVTWNLGDLAPGTTVLHMTVQVDASRLANLSNTASVSSTTSDPDTTNNSATEATVVNTSADVQITKSDSPDPVTAGNNLTYTLTVKNAGPSFARSVQVTDPAPGGPSYVGSDPGRMIFGSTLPSPLSTLAPYTTLFRTTVQVDASRLANLSNTASVSST